MLAEVSGSSSSYLSDSMKPVPQSLKKIKSSTQQQYFERDAGLLSSPKHQNRRFNKVPDSISKPVLSQIGEYPASNFSKSFNAKMMSPSMIYSPRRKFESIAEPAKTINEQTPASFKPELRSNSKKIRIQSPTASKHNFMPARQSSEKKLIVESGEPKTVFIDLSSQKRLRAHLFNPA